jgi:hypothetical protein
MSTGQVSPMCSDESVAYVPSCSQDQARRRGEKTMTVDQLRRLLIAPEIIVLDVTLASLVALERALLLEQLRALRHRHHEEAGAPKARKPDLVSRAAAATGQSSLQARASRSHRGLHRRGQ